MRKNSPRGDDVIDLTGALSSLISDIALTCPTFSHIDSDRTLVCIGSNREGRGGLYGKLVPLRFRDGDRFRKYRNRCYEVPDITHGGREILYLIYFYMPRFFDLPPDEKLRVIFHELYHISPAFNGDIRRMGAVRQAHGHSRRHFDSRYREDLSSFERHPRAIRHADFLSLNSSSLFRRYRHVTGIRMRAPRPVIINDAAPEN